MVTKARIRIGLALAFVIATTAVVLAAAPPLVPKADRKFDHDQHAKILAGTGQNVDCATCHKVGTDGKSMGREHDRCDGGKCHNLDYAKQSCDYVKVAGPKSPARQCQICHVATRKECLPADLPVLTKTVSFTPTFEHEKHLKLGGVGQKECASCHKAEAGPPPADVHMSCAGDPKSPNKKAGCHGDSSNKVPMTSCATCHVAQDKAVKAPPNDEFSVAKTFNHDRHNLQKNMSNCSLCHSQLATAPNGSFPKPAMAGCGTSGCHDGKGAFAAFGTTCTKCHTGTSPAMKTAQNVGFSHAVHGGPNVKVKIDDCAQCHSLEADGTLAPPGEGKNHAPCANSGCHQAEFASRQPKICASCHTEEAPWAKAAARLPERTVEAGGPIAREWWETTNHAVHLKKLGTGNQACETCHGTKLDGGAMQRDHKACAPCHGKGQPPAMTDCKMCHRNQVIAKAPVSDWSVAATFKHEQHANDPRSHAATPCIGCHSSTQTATDLTTITAPAMAQCEGCHDGKSAFKATGFECARCHTKGTPAAAPPKPTAMLDSPTPTQLTALEAARSP